MARESNGKGIMADCKYMMAHPFDWLKQMMKFKHDKRLTNLKEEGFNGYIQLNFFKGHLVDANRYDTIKPEDIKIGGTG
ncbi:hypothetical protein LCGC14_0399200 [marine sediment metagenome]|uniref:Uncharacterized protein n=1 Tax=marine sediment metagenome TaxID=412755 RepID=A0A0F9T325_9ZZZZ